MQESITKLQENFQKIPGLSNKAQENNTSSATFMPMAYTNVGILFKVLRPYIGTIQLYKVYILFESFMFLLTGLVFYMIIEKYISNINSKVIAIIFSIIYVIGYPLNAWISGFHYLILGILFIETILYFLTEDRKIEFGQNLIIMFLINFGLILSYSLFCPFMYLSEFIYFIHKYIKQRNENNKKNKIEVLTNVFITLVVPGIIGVTYLIVPSFGQISGYITLEGWLYKNLWSNFLMFLPFTIYAIYKNLKTKKFTIDNIVLGFLLLYMTILFIGMRLEKISEYYFYKNYFALWIIIVYFHIKGILTYMQENKDKYTTNMYTLFYLIVFTIMLCTDKVYVIDEPYDNFKSIMQVYVFNKTMMQSVNGEFLTKEELELLSQAEKNVKINWQEQNNIVIITDPNEGLWLQSLTGYKDAIIENRENQIMNLLQENYKYIISFENKETYKNIEKYINKNNIKLIDGNNFGKIYIKEEK